MTEENAQKFLHGNFCVEYDFGFDTGTVGGFIT